MSIEESQISSNIIEIELVPTTKMYGAAYPFSTNPAKVAFLPHTQWAHLRGYVAQDKTVRSTSLASPSGWVPLAGGTGV